MKFAIKSIVAAVAFVAVGAASAAPLTLAVGGSVTSMGWTVSDLTGTGALSFSASLIGALNAGGVQVAGIDPAVVAVTMKAKPKDYQYKTISIGAPVQSLSGTFDGTTVSISGVGTVGGAMQTATADDFTTTGGYLGITNLRVDLGSKKVFADLNGDNGLGVVNNVEMWDITTITGATSFLAVEGTSVSVNQLSGLKINAPAFAMFSQALGLTVDGENALRGVTDFGTINSTISVTATAVPEASSYAMLFAGLMVVGAVARRRAK